MLTAAQICQRAATDAGSPNYLQQAADKLNAILSELCQLYDFDINMVKTTIAVSGGINQYNLPQNYLRGRNLFYNINGQIFTLNEIPLKQWQTLFQGPGNQTYPEWWASDISPLALPTPTPPQLFLWPTPAQSITLYVEYMLLQADIANAQTSTQVPWMPFQNYLIKRLTADMMNSTADGRKEQLITECEEFLKKYCKLANDQEGYAVTIPKDARRFRGGGANLANTKSLPL